MGVFRDILNELRAIKDLLSQVLDETRKIQNGVGWNGPGDRSLEEAIQDTNERLSSLSETIGPANQGANIKDRLTEIRDRIPVSA